MRNIALVAALACLTLAGCTANRKWGMFGSNPKTDTTAVVAPPSATALVNYLNDNADRVQTVQCSELDMNCRQGIKPGIGLSGKLVLQKPRNFRMNAYFAGKQELDVGSNADEFWFWVARGDPFQFHCSYQALAEGKVRQMPLPIQPEWIIEAMGLAKYDPAGQYEVKMTQDSVRLEQHARSPQGRPITKVTVFRRGRAPEGSPQVTGHVIIDDTTGQEVCSAEVLQVALDRGTNAIVPRKVALHMKQERVTLTLTLNDMTINGQLARPDLYFTRRPLNGIRSYDLALGQVDGQMSSIRQVGGLR